MSSFSFPCFKKETNMKVTLKFNANGTLSILVATVLFASLTFSSKSVGNVIDEEVSGVFYVAPNGDDNNKGTQDAPFATLERARDAIRESRGLESDSPYCVRIAKGVYQRRAPFELDARDSHTRYVGDSDGVKLIAGFEIQGWSPANKALKEKFPNSDDEIWRAELPTVNGETVYFEQLFVNEGRATRSRFPNDGFLTPESVWEESSMNPQNRKADVSSTPQEIRAKKGDLDELYLEKIPENELKYAQFVVHHHWDTTRRILLGYDADARALKSRGAPMKSWNPWRDTSLYYIENLRTSFDEPGEWFYAGTEGCVYYRPRKGERIDSTHFIAPISGVNRLVVIAAAENADSQKVSDIRFENICFSYTDAPRDRNIMQQAELPEIVTGDLSRPGPSQFEPAQAASFADSVLSVTNSSNIVFKDCEVSHTGEYGLSLKNCDNCSVIRTNFKDLGAGGVRIGGGTLDVGNRVENCEISGGGRFFASAVAVWIGQNTEEISIVHNDVNDFYYTGVSVGWVWGYNGGRAFRNRIEYNRIWKIGQGQMSDMGGVYTLGTSTGTRVCNNVIFDVSSYGYGGWGLYPDEGSEGILFENNLVYDTTDGSFHQHYGKNNIVRNNILVRSRVNPARIGQPAHQIAITRVEDHLSTVFERNIIYWKDENGVALGYNASKAKAQFSKNLWFNAKGETLFDGKTHDEWSKETGKDLDGLVADPLFVDPDANDFHLKQGSPAEQIGFVPFDYTQAGVVK